jgi:hypothetical protein
MRIRTFATIAVAVMVAAVCDSSTAPPSGSRLAELVRQESKWESQGLHDYLFDYEYQFAGAIEAAQIYVSDDSVAAAVDPATGKELPLDQGIAWPTVDSLFARAREAIASKAVDVSVAYDATLGYPTRIDISLVVATPAGGSSARASKLRRMVVLTPS